jgi:phosphatidylinositol alpha-1,6-mannosyltransferase
LIAARLLGARFIIFAYGMEITTSRWRGMKRWMFRQADRVITISAYSRILLLRLGVPPDRVGLIPPSIDGETFGASLQATNEEARARLGIASDVPVLLSVAVLKQQYKGIDTVLRATDLLRRRYQGLRYIVIGDGPDRPRLESIARELQLERHVTFVGSVDDATKGLYYAACDLFMLPNRVEYGSGGERSEGFGIVFLEAALFGKVSIGGQGGSLDAVVNEETGLNVSGKSAGEVANAVTKLLNDPQLAEQFSVAARRRAETHFSTQRVTERLSEELARNPRAPKSHRPEPMTNSRANE